MREFQFQYNNLNKSIRLLIICVLTLLAALFIGFLLPNYRRKELSLFLGISTIVIPIIIFLIFRKKVLDNCVANLNDDSVHFKFKRDTRVINFDDIISYKAYYGRNGSVLYLKNKVDNFKISVNNSYCKTADFDSFCEAIINQLDKYRLINNPSLIHEGSIFATKGMLYFLIVINSIYLLAFFIETNTLRIAIGIGGGFYLFIMWKKYFLESNKRSD